MWQAIIENFKKLVTEDDYKGNLETLFGQADPGQMRFLTDLYGTFSKFHTIYDEAELEYLKYVKVPESVLSFYREYEPKELPTLPCYLNLLDLRAIREENSELAPSAVVIAHGLLTIGTTMGGNAVCMDLNEIDEGEPRILYVDRSYINFDYGTRKVMVSFRGLDDRGPMTMKLIKNELPVIAETFTEFLEKLSTGQYEDIEEFYNQYRILA